jgi:hypothetical protein
MNVLIGAQGKQAFVLRTKIGRADDPASRLNGPRSVTLARTFRTRIKLIRIDTFVS